MRKKILALVTYACAAMLLGGCAGGISNEYVEISKYKGVKVSKQEKIEVTDEEVEAQIQSVQEANANTVNVTDRPAKESDTVTIDYEGKKDGVAFEGGTAADYPLTLGSNTFIEGFESGIVGHSIGETFDLELTFPEDYANEELAGEDVIFTVTIKAITQNDLPKLNDEFVQSVSETSKTVEEYKEEIRASIEEDEKETARTALKEEAWQEVLKNTKVKTYPEEQVQKVTKQYNEQYQAMADYYGIEFEEFLTSYMGMDEETFQEQVAQAAKDQVKQDLAMELIAKEENLELSDEEMEKVYETYAKEYGFDSVDALKEVVTEEDMRRMATLDEVQEWLADHCKQVKEREETSTEE